MDLWDLSDDDEEIIAYINRPRALRQIGPRTNVFESLSDKKFVRRFRLTKETTLLLLQEIEYHLTFKTNKNEAVTPMNQLLCTLRYYATGSQLITCGDVIGVQEPTACRIVHRVTHAIASMYYKYIKMPDTNGQHLIAAEFYKIARFPRVVGAIDCTHVRIISPSNIKHLINLKILEFDGSQHDKFPFTGGSNAELYRNRKGYFSINVQCIAAADLSFQDVVARWHGSAHDSNIWDNCAVKRSFLNRQYNDKLLLGDSGYAQTPYMMTPLAQGSAQSRGENLYQESQIKTRNVIERAFGIWKRRFPILSRGISVQLRRVPGIIVATAVLHNIAIWQKEDVPPEDPDYPLLEELPDHHILSSQQSQGSRNLERTILIEEYLAR